MTRGIFLIEDHDEALKVWRKNNLKDFDLVHIDAHIDFGFHPARPIERIINEARSLKELKRNLEYSLAFRRYEDDFDKQTNIGNYIYPGIEEGIVKDFYWVVPGESGEFKKSEKFIKGILRNLARQAQLSRQAKPINLQTKDGFIKARIFDRDFIVCTLERLPVLRQRVLLDIDVDFLVIDSLINANNTVNIGKRVPWIYPEEMIRALKNRIPKPKVITIAYSVNGGFTPMKYKYLGDEIAHRLAPERFREQYGERLMAAVFFERFEAKGRKEDYQKAVKLNPSYKAADNNYGPLYLNLRKLPKAEREFKRIGRADPKNPYALAGLGEIYSRRKYFPRARRYFYYALRYKKDWPSALFGLAQAEFKLNNFKKAKVLFQRYQKLKPLQPHSYYFLGRISEKEKAFEEAFIRYQDAMRLGFNSIEIISQLIKVAFYLRAKRGIIEYVITKYKGFKKEFLRVKKLSLRRGKNIKDLRKAEKKMAALEERLRNADFEKSRKGE